MKYHVTDRDGTLLRTDDLQAAVNMSVRHRCPIYLTATGEIVVTKLRATQV